MKERMTGKNFMKLIISIWCIAIIKAKSARKITTPIFFHPSKDDLSYLRREEKFQISPLDGAQYAKFSSNPKQATRRNNAKYNSKMKLQHTPKIEKKRTQPIEQKPLLFSFLLKNKTSTRKLRSSHGKKNR
jgi:hypothetical protein